MVRKIGIALIFVGVAAFSPAPINHSHEGYTKQSPQTQAQLAAQQKFNGVSPVVGQVPANLDEVGHTRFTNRVQQVSHTGDQTIQAGSMSTDKVGAAAITSATTRVAAEEHQGQYAWLFAILIAVAGFLGWKFFQYKIEKATPVPTFSKRLLKEFEKGKN